MRGEITEGTDPYLAWVQEDDFHTVSFQFEALRLIEVVRLGVSDDDSELMWKLTHKGRRVMMESRVVKSDPSKKVEGLWSTDS